MTRPETQGVMDVLEVAERFATAYKLPNTADDFARARNAIAELIESDREYDEAEQAVRLHEVSYRGRQMSFRHEVYDRRNAARTRRAAALARFGGAK